ncbi:hypothetical protein [Neptuniibacter halophilus]|uniref:hypothetical protein n=1 Tax=Neptuniibacter halophilus TaxID=651666 RepID=UPI002573BA18|nr:hypothetical protein [Neptuniibacter halophilus]
MRWLLAIPFFILLAGCAGQKLPEVAPPVDRVEPINVSLPQLHSFSPQSDYLQPLLTTMAREPFYSLTNPRLLLTGYEFSHTLAETDRRKTVYAFKASQGGSWGYLTSGIGMRPVANVIAIQNSSLGSAYALVLKSVKLCLVSQASGVPVWQGGKWQFPARPGYFECTGMTNQNIYRVGTGLPGLLGPYFSEKDSVLVFRNLGQLQQVLWALKYQFPELNIPVIQP